MKKGNAVVNPNFGQLDLKTKLIPPEEHGCMHIFYMYVRLLKSQLLQVCQLRFEQPSESKKLDTRFPKCFQSGLWSQMKFYDIQHFT